jgi:hypothetical protein
MSLASPPSLPIVLPITATNISFGGAHGEVVGNSPTAKRPAEGVTLQDGEELGLAACTREQVGLAWFSCTLKTYVYPSTGRLAGPPTSTSAFLVASFYSLLALVYASYQNRRFVDRTITIVYGLFTIIDLDRRWTSDSRFTEDWFLLI